MKIILANCLIRNRNLGCLALSYSTMHLIDELLGKKGIEYSFYLPQSGYDNFSEHTIYIGKKKLSYISCYDISINSIADFIKKLFHFKAYFASIKIYATADYVFDVGLGDSFSDIYGDYRFNTIFAQHKLGQIFHIPYCILPQTIGPFRCFKNREKAMKCVSRAKFVIVRDKQSYDLVKHCLLDCAVSEAIDVAFFMPYTKKSFNTAYIHVGLNVSGLLWHGGYTCDNQFRLKLDYRKLVHEIIDYFLNMEGAVLHLVPHVVGHERDVENDYAVSYDLKEEYHNDNLLLAPSFLSPVDAKGYIAGMDFFMGARMHAAIAAFSSGVPILPMGYSRKFNGMFVDTLDYKDMLDMRHSDNDSAIALVKHCFARRKEEKAIINDRMNTIVAEKQEMLVNQLKEFMGL